MGIRRKRRLGRLVLKMKTIMALTQMLPHYKWVKRSLKTWRRMGWYRPIAGHVLWIHGVHNQDYWNWLKSHSVHE